MAFSPEKLVSFTGKSRLTIHVRFSFRENSLFFSHEIDPGRNRVPLRRAPTRPRPEPDVTLEISAREASVGSARSSTQGRGFRNEFQLRISRFYCQCHVGMAIAIFSIFMVFFCQTKSIRRLNDSTSKSGFSRERAGDRPGARIFRAVRL